MKEFIVAPKDDGRRLDKWMLAEMPVLSLGACQKYLRLKKVRLNGKPAKADARLAAGDVLNIYLNDELFEKPHKVDTLLSTFHYHLTIVYEDENILLVDKRPGVIIHSDGTERLNTLVTHVRAYLYQKGEYDSMNEGVFPPSPCNRIDRFTGGIVIFAKNREAMHIMDQKIRSREVEKHYLCICIGEMNRPSGLLVDYILKEEGRRKVLIRHTPFEGAQIAKTGYSTIAVHNGLALVDCDLQTGRTHQIRAQFALAGHPLLGDGQYGDPEESKRFGREYQALYAYRITFAFTSDAGILNGLNGKSCYVKNVPFVEEFFPGLTY